MKIQSMISLRLIRLLICVFILFEQAKSQDPCPSKHRCLKMKECSPSSMKLIRGTPINCGLNRAGNANARICCPESSFRPEPTTPPPRRENPTDGPRIPLNANPGNCGKSFGRPTTEGLVIGGVDAEQGAFPWMVAIMIVDDRGIESPHCTGYLIDSKHVISAAHCFASKPSSSFSTRIGNVDLTMGDVYPVRNVLVHRGYKNGQFYNDIALLTLSRDVDIPNFTPICLPSSNSATHLTGRGTTVIGWGATRLGGPMSLILKQLSAMPVVSNEKCEKAYRDALTSSSFRRQFPRGISSAMICAGFLDEEEKDGCGGDSGGPLMMREDDRWYAVGVVSYGYKCGKKGFPGGYTKVSEFVDWINDNKS